MKKYIVYGDFELAPEIDYFDTLEEAEEEYKK